MVDATYSNYTDDRQPDPSSKNGAAQADFPSSSQEALNQAVPLEEKASKLAIADNTMASPDNSATPPTEAASASKPKRVRTGCLTCRERHLKCDEGLPNCQNCRKSNRTCKRGVRLNFIDTKIEDPQIIPPSSNWVVAFQDESREIASEYKGGAGRYAAPENDPMDVVGVASRAAAATVVMNAPPQAHQPHQPHQSHPSDRANAPTNYQNNGMQDGGREEQYHHSNSISSVHSSNSGHTNMYTPSQASFNGSEQDMAPPGVMRDCLNTAEETLFVQVFVEEVGLWMDSMDPHKHFSRILPFYALGEPMLLNAILACGARHLTLVNPSYGEDKALNYYDTATRCLLKSLQNPNRDTIICATAAVILNVYEIMSEKALQRMNHIAGARALIKECGWNARSQGIGAACFWLNVGMELLSCLHFNWQVAWNPDDWGVDASMTGENRSGSEEQWTYKIVYVTAKIVNFRATIPRFTDPNPTAHAMRMQDRIEQWNRLKNLCDAWNENVPRTMHPMAYLLPHLTASNSTFPEIWLIKRTCIIARLFYHTAMCLLPQMHPTYPADTPEMHEMKMHHARQICGIVAHVKDRGVASASLRCIALAAECLTDFKEQNESLVILEKIQKETGWRIDFLKPELKKKWGWNEEHMSQGPPPAPSQQQHQQMPTMMQSPPMDFQYSRPTTSLPPPATAPVPAQQMPPNGIVNPMMRTADFSGTTHPYQAYYVAPNQNHNDAHYFYRL